MATIAETGSNQRVATGSSHRGSSQSRPEDRLILTDTADWAARAGSRATLRGDATASAGGGFEARPQVVGESASTPGTDVTTHVDVAREKIHAELNNEGFWNFDVTHDDLLAITEKLRSFPPADRNALVAGLSQDDLERWTGEIDNGGGLLGTDLTRGLDADERGDLHRILAESLDGEQLERVYHAYDDSEQKLELAAAVAEHGSPDQKVGLIDRLRDDVTPGGFDSDVHAGGSPYGASPRITTRADVEGLAVADLLGSLGGNPQALDAAYASLDDEQLNAVYAATDRFSSASGLSQGSTFDGTRLATIVDAAATSQDAELKARVFSAAAGQLDAIRDAVDGITEFDYSDGAASEQIAGAMTRLLETDVKGVVGALEASDPYGRDLTSYLRTTVAEDNNEQIGRLIGQLRQDVDLAIPVDNGTRYPNAELLGYFSGATQAAIFNNGADAEAQAAIVQDIFLSVLDFIPGADLARGGARTLSRGAVFGVTNSISECTTDLRRGFYELAFPPDAGAAENSYRTWETSVLSANR